MVANGATHLLFSSRQENPNRFGTEYKKFKAPACTYPLRALPNKHPDKAPVRRCSSK